MKIHIHNTDRIVTYNGIPARAWEGHTDAGIPVIAFITRIAAERDQDLAEFERDLCETTPPSADVQAWPARMLLDDAPEQRAWGAC